MFRWLTQYFQNKAEAKKNLMVPTRKPTVKINLKSINFAKGPVEEKLAAQSHKRGASPRPKVPGSLDEVAPQPVPKPAAAPSAFGKEVRRLDTEQLKSKIYERQTLGFSTLIFAAAILFCLTSLGIIYVSSERSQRQVYLDRCQNAFREGVSAGYDLEGVNCQLPTGFLASLDISQAQDAFEAVEAQVEAQRNVLGNTQAELDLEIATLQGYLEAFGLPPNQIPDGPIATANANESITQKQRYVLELQALLEREAGDLQETLDSYELLLESNAELDLAAETEFYEDFIAREPEEQYAGYTQLVLRYNELVQKVSQLQNNPFVAGTLATGEVGAYPFFSGEEFKTLWLTVPKENIEPIAQVEITGDVAADRRIIRIAEERGYVRQVQARIGELVSLDNELVLPPVASAYRELASAAAGEGVSLGVVSGFRSPDIQRDIFLSRLNAAAIAQLGVEPSLEAVASGELDNVIDSVLTTSSIPGYSRHHTGYALDLRDDNSAESFTRFRDTPAFAWISANNYFHAKRFGFIPSYPEGAERQGPDPEAWEYVWVGPDAILN